MIRCLCLGVLANWVTHPPYPHTPFPRVFVHLWYVTSHAVECGWQRTTGNNSFSTLCVRWIYSGFATIRCYLDGWMANMLNSTKSRNGVIPMLSCEFRVPSSPLTPPLLLRVEDTYIHPPIDDRLPGYNAKRETGKAQWGNTFMFFSPLSPLQATQRGKDPQEGVVYSGMWVEETKTH